MLKTGFLNGRFCGSFAGCETKVDQKTGFVKSVVTFMTLKGKKYRFTVTGDVADFSNVAPFGVITVDVTDVEIGKSGEFGNYGDQNFTVASMQLAASTAFASDNRPASVPTPEKKAA